jgi:hypothetical protein
MMNLCVNVAWAHLLACSEAMAWRSLPSARSRMHVRTHCYQCCCRRTAHAHVPLVGAKEHPQNARPSGTPRECSRDSTLCACMFSIYWAQSMAGFMARSMAAMKQGRCNLGLVPARVFQYEEHHFARTFSLSCNLKQNRCCTTFPRLRPVEPLTRG